MPDRSRRWPSCTSLTVQGAEHARLTRNGKALVRVHGHCHGLVSCAGQALWCWGPFAHAFAVPAQAGELNVRALGVFGVRRASVTLDPRAELREPRVSSRPVHAPRTAPLPFASMGRAKPPAVAVTAPHVRGATLPVPRQLDSHAPSLILRATRVALRLPRPGESR